MPNTPVEIRQGIVVYAQPEQPWSAIDAAVEAQVLALFGRLGKVVTVPERLMGAATAIIRRRPGVPGAAGRGAGRRRRAQGLGAHWPPNS